MNFKRICRVLICLLLICCILVNVSPIKAQATSIAISPVGIGIAIVIGAVLIGLGITCSDEANFNYIVDTISQADFITKYLVDGMVQLWWDATQSHALHAPVGLIEEIRQYLYDNYILSEVDYYYPGCDRLSKNFHSNYMTICELTYHYLWYSPTYKMWCAIGSNNEFMFTYQDNGDTYVTLVEGGTFSYTDTHSNSISTASGVTILGTDTFYNGEDDTYVAEPGSWCNYGLTLADCPPLSVPYEEAYPDWYAGAITVPGTVSGEDEDTIAVPVGGVTDSSTEEDVKILDQEIIWGIVLEDTETGGGSTDPTEPDDPVYADPVPATLLERLFGGVTSRIDAVKISIEEIPGQFKEFFQDLKNGIEELPSKFKTWFEDIKEALISIKTLLQELPDKFEQWFTNISNWLSKLWEILSDIPQAIADVLTALFVPAEDYISVKVDALRAKFPFIDSVIATGEFIRDSVSGASGPPAIYVDLGLATSGNYGSQKVLLADFAWYAKYKPTVDTLLSAALWAFFGWRVFLKLPGIISGESGYIGEVAAHKEKMDKIRSGPPGKR